MSKYIAQINSENIVTGVKMVKPTFTTDENNIQINSFDTSLLGKKYQDGNFVDVATVNIKPVITTRDFKRRFTQAERIAIRAAQQTDVIIDDFVDLLDSNGELTTDDPDVILGVNYLAQQGIITESRIDEILT